MSAMEATAASDSLLQYLRTALENSFPGHRSFQLQLIRSTPRRSHALFPHASNLRTKVYQQELLLVVSESTLEQLVSVPVFALEASIYSIPSTSTSLIYISKVDTTGVIATPLNSPPRPSPTNTVVAAFLSYHLAHPPNQSQRIRIHIFAKSQPQYLFPGSIENAGKKVLDDKALIRWWKKCISQAVVTKRTATANPDEGERTNDKIDLFYLIPGLSYLESLPYVPKDSSPKAPHWHYSHPYSTIPSPLFPSSISSSSSSFSASASTSIGDHIPCFPDDPKSRFQTSLTSSSVASSGDQNDYDDVMRALSSTAFTSLSSGMTQRDLVEREREREKDRLRDGLLGGVEEWWERMAWRQECCSGVLVGFFVVALDRSTTSATGLDPAASSTDTSAAAVIPAAVSARAASTSAPEPYAAAIPHANFTALWSQFHNVDYAATAIARLNLAATKWTSDACDLIKAEGYSAASASSSGDVAAQAEDGDAIVKRRQALYEKEAFALVVVDNPELVPKEKRALELMEEKVVNKMIPRKKVKKDA